MRKLEFLSLATIVLTHPFLCGGKADVDARRVQQLFHQASNELQDNRTKELALKHISEAIKLKPDMAMLYSLRGAILADLDEIEAAVVDVKKALKLDPQSWQVNYFAAGVIRQTGDLSSALFYADRAVKLSDNATTRGCRSEIYTKLRKLKKAEEDLDAALKFSPGEITLHGRREAVAVMLEDWKTVKMDAEFCIVKRLTGEFGDRQHFVNLGLACERTGDLKRAEYTYKQGIKLYPTLIDLHSGLLRIYEKTGRTMDAALERKAIKATESEF